MAKNKYLLIGLGVASAGVVLYFLLRKNGEKNVSNDEKVDSANNTDTNTNGCPSGQIKCPNKNLCYDPKNYVNIIINPCSNWWDFGGI